MRIVQKAQFTRLTTAEIAHIDEVLEVTSVGVTIGYFVPASAWELLKLVITGAEWDDQDELAADALAIVGEGE